MRVENEPTDRGPESPWLQLAPGARFTIRQTIDITRPDGPADHRDAQLDVDVLGWTPDGHMRASAVLDRPADPVPIGALELVVRSDGDVVGTPRLVCGGVSDGDVRRTIPHLLGLLAGPGPSLRSELAAGVVAADPVELSGGVGYHAVLPVDDVWFFRLSLTGTARTIVRTQRDAASGTRSAHVRSEFDGSVLAHGESDTASDSQVVIDERIEATIRPSRLDLREACARAPLSTGDVSAALEPVEEQIRECWRRELATRPNTQGRLMLHITVQPDGAFSDVHVTNSTIGSDAFADCLVGVVARLRAPRGSARGPASFAFPRRFVP